MMCESTVYMFEDGEQKEVMREVAKIDVIGNKVILIGILGDKIELEGFQVAEANFMEHRIVLGKLN